MLLKIDTIGFEAVHRCMAQVYCLLISVVCWGVGVGSGSGVGWVGDSGEDSPPANI